MTTTDNRDMSERERVLEATVESLRKRVRELEQEKADAAQVRDDTIDGLNAHVRSNGQRGKQIWLSSEPLSRT